jgi:O-antigen/teichoic acid export membrane protein
MLQRLVRNALISALAYGVVGALALVSVSIIIRSYGLTAFGLIVLVRSFLPAAFFALIDFGMPENATQAVARARGGGSWESAGELVSLLLCGALTIGLVAGTTLCLATPALSSVFNVAVDQHAAFYRMMLVTGLALPILFPGIVLEGVIKGFENYAWLRWLEMASTAGYVAAVIALASAGAAYENIAYAFLASIVARCAVLSIAVWRIAAASQLRFRRWGHETFHTVVYQSRIMFLNRLVGVLQSQLQPLLIGVSVGASGVGVYEMLTRLPRFLKSVLGLLSAAILPVSARIEQALDSERMHRLGRGGFVLPAVIAMPILAALALFAEDVLRLWIGPSVSNYWPWLSAMLLVPAISVLIGPGQVALLVRFEFVRRMTRLFFFQGVLQYAISLALVGWLSERAFILGQVVAAAAFMPVIARLMLKEWQLQPQLFWSTISKHLAIILMLAIPVAILKVAAPPLGHFGLLVAITLCCGIAWVLAYALIASREDRYLFANILRVAMR